MATPAQIRTDWSIRARRAMAALIGISVIAFYVTWYRPATDHLGVLQSRIDDTRRALDEVQSRTLELPALRGDVYRLQARYEPFSRKMPRQVDLATFLKDLGTICQQSGVRRFDCSQGELR